MPHISKRALSSKKSRELEERLFTAFANVSARSRRRVYEELLTPTERVMLAKRLEMMLLIERGVSEYRISKALNVSHSTVARFAVALESGKFQATNEWLGRRKLSRALLEVLSELVAVPFEASPYYRKAKRGR